MSENGLTFPCRQIPNLRPPFNIILKGSRKMKFQIRKPYLVQTKENLGITEDGLRQEVRKEKKIAKCEMQIHAMIKYPLVLIMYENQWLQELIDLCKNLHILKIL